MADAALSRKRRGAWFTPPELVERVVDATIDRDFVAARVDRPIRILDPACGDGRFLAAAAAQVARFGGRTECTGTDIDADAVAAAAHALPDAELVCADALADPLADPPSVPQDRRRDRSGSDREGVFDLVIGNPPFLSQMATVTSRNGASRHGGGPYADAAAEFLALAADVVDADGGRVAFVLPQSILSARDADPIRRRIDQRAQLFWSSWTGECDFDAQVFTCALAFEFGEPGAGVPGAWAHVVADRLGVPPLPPSLDDPERTLGDLAWLNANFRDEYYGMVPAVDDHDDGPPLVTSGLIDPGRCLWGGRPVRFAKRRFAAPRLDLAELDTKMRSWADRRLVPKVLVANQTPILEAVADPTGDWLPGVPVVSVYPHGGPSSAQAVTWDTAAVLTSPTASAWAWHRSGGTGLSADTIRVGPAMLADLPWPAGDLGEAVRALRAGDVRSCGASVDRAYGLDAAERERMMAWWEPILTRIEQRSS